MIKILNEKTEEKIDEHKAINKANKSYPFYKFKALSNSF